MPECFSQCLFARPKPRYAWRMPLRAILFDKDGTLVDFHATWGAATYAAMHRMSRGDGAKIARLVEANDYDLERRRIRPTSPLIAGSTADYGVTWAEILGEAAGDAFFEQMDAIFAEEATARVVALGEAARLLAELKASGYVLGLVTNDSELGARQHCDRLGFTPHLDFIVGYDSGHGRKPEPGQILAFLARHGIDASETALVGDSLHDLHAARAAGAVAIGVLSGLASEADLAGDADHIIPDIMALPGLLATLRSVEA
jgi:phosphoglycolate phosphatase